MRTSLVVLALAGIASRLPAQTCLGNASFSHSSFKLYGNVDFESTKTHFGGGAMVGASHPFLLGGITVTSLDHGGSSFGVVGLGGYQVEVGSSKPVAVCPLLSASVSSGPNDADSGGDDVSGRSFGFGAGIGVELGSGTKVKFVPTGSLQVVHARVKLKGVTTQTLSDTYELLTMGAGIVLSGRITLLPHLIIPIGSTAGGDTQFGMSVSIGLKGGNSSM